MLTGQIRIASKWLPISYLITAARPSRTLVTWLNFLIIDYSAREVITVTARLSALSSFIKCFDTLFRRGIIDSNEYILSG